MKLLRFDLPVVQVITLLLLSFIAWCIFTQEIHFAAFALGVVASLLSVLYSFPIFFEHDTFHRSDFIFRFDLIFIFAFIVMIQSYLSSIALIRMMITGNYNPGIVRIKTKLRSNIGRTLLANTISLVPGTLSLWMEGNHIYVHWFDMKTYNSLKAGRMIKNDLEFMLSRIFG
jgi:multicomponent Na+:H+ antiporter subunit E